MLGFGNKTLRRKVIVTGAAQSGKTVFLVSLIDHLKHFHPNNDWGLKIAGRKSKLNVSFRAFMPTNKLGDPHVFPFERYRDRLSNHSWPEKTETLLRWACHFAMSDDGKQSDVSLELVDMPGERIADLEMIETRSYAHWSDARLKVIEDSSEQFQIANDSGFWAALKAAEKQSGTDAELVASYKRFLLGCARACYQGISPSTFMLDTAGGEPDPNADDETLLATRFSGLPEAEFVPLSATARKASESVTRTFTKHFARYDKVVLRPLSALLRDADSLIILLDLQRILLSGATVYNETEQFIDSVTNIVMRKRLKLFGSKIARVLFLATKEDMVRRDEREKLAALLGELVHQHHAELEHKGVSAHIGTCSAVISTGCVPGAPDQLCGLIDIDENDRGIDYTDAEIAEQIRKREVGQAWGSPVHISSLPEAWPHHGHWEIESFEFPDFRPIIPALRNRPPWQYGLSGVVKFLICK